MTVSPFQIPVSDLIADPGSRRTVGFEATVDWQVEMAEVGPVVGVEMLLENASGVLVARGEATTELQLACHRCLRQWSESLDVEVMEAFGFEGAEGEYPLSGDIADLEPMVRDAVLLEVPLRPLCRDDCRGICATCGADLNSNTCPGHGDESTSPFAELRELLEP